MAEEEKKKKGWGSLLLGAAIDKTETEAQIITKLEGRDALGELDENEKKALAELKEKQKAKKEKEAQGAATKELEK